MRQPLAGLLLRMLGGSLSFSCSTFHPAWKITFCGNLKGILRGSLVQPNRALYLSTFLYFTIHCTIFQYFTILQSRNPSRNLFKISSQSLYNLFSTFSSQSLSQSFHNLLHLQNCSYLSTLFVSTHPFACIWDFLRAYLMHYMQVHCTYMHQCTYLRLIFKYLFETNAIWSHAPFMARTINAFTHVPDIPARLFPIYRLFLVTINGNHYLFSSVT